MRWQYVHESVRPLTGLGVRRGMWLHSTLRGPQSQTAGFMPSPFPKVRSESVPPRRKKSLKRNGIGKLVDTCNWDHPAFLIRISICETGLFGEQQREVNHSNSLRGQERINTSYFVLGKLSYRIAPSLLRPPFLAVCCFLPRCGKR